MLAIEKPATLTQAADVSAFVFQHGFDEAQDGSWMKTHQPQWKRSFASSFLMRAKLAALPVPHPSRPSWVRIRVLTLAENAQLQPLNVQR